MLVALGIVTLVAVIIGVIVVMSLARKHQAEDEPPPSRGGDFMAPVSSGQFRFRAPDESPEQFQARVEAENEEIASSRKSDLNKT